MKFRGFNLFHNNREAAESMVRQIDEFPSFFTPQGDRPLIVDCGANIGVSVLEWKTRWPQAEIICFEPDPFASEILQMNIDKNHTVGIRCVHAAVSDFDGTVDFYGDLSPTADARGNSLEATWADREGSSQTQVQCTRLSPYIAGRDVSFLKLDIEGAEQRVLTEIADCLGRVEAMYVEVHETDESRDVNSLAAIEKILAAAGFTIEMEQRYSEHAFPESLDQWQEETNAALTQILCWR
ncbi:2-O-methyltransferase NoeI [Rubripirellula lacrimiformis]|uniref:2-O-methyltransferase NoeI n=2 Tax=Rubripirellula lacrimiformis TaxID=1930273 RepID=A0A517NJR3_9BACT|nr:2-O-methyltransferase NoeI [Rubripirellula lacrimiformis]